MSSNLKALHTYFIFVTRKSSKKSSKIEKKIIIELIITENHGCDPGTGRR
jgi:phage terminase large subunit